MRSLPILLFLLLAPANGLAQDYEVVFEGRPVTRVESAYGEAASHGLNPEESFEYLVRIIQRDGKYYWASRGMKELIRGEGVAYVTYHAVDGSGYVRVLSPMMLDMLDQLPAETRNKEAAYMEHMLIQLASITYYGNRAATQ